MTIRRFRYSSELGRLVELSSAYVDDDTGPMIMADLPAYQSPIDGRTVDGRAARRNDLKRSNCREYDPSERDAAAKTRAAEDAQLEQVVGRTVEKHFHEMTPRKRELLVQALQAGLEATIVRK